MSFISPLQTSPITGEAGLSFFVPWKKLISMVKIRGRETYPFYFGASPATLKLASELRAGMTIAEKVLWERLRNRKCSNFKFRRQHPIGEFIVDFFCYEAMLVIELDGEVHHDEYQKERDFERTEILNEFEITVIRFKNETVLNDIESVLMTIEKALSERNISNK